MLLQARSDGRCYCSAYYADERDPFALFVQLAQFSVSCVWLPALCRDSSKVSADCCLSDVIVAIVYIHDMINSEHTHVVTYYLLCRLIYWGHSSRDLD
jgi:hypothetical protein